MLADAIPVADNLASYGAAGLMGLMWLWERRTSSERERQLDEAHQRIMADRIQLDALIDVVKHNTESMASLTASHDELLRKLENPQNLGD